MKNTCLFYSVSLECTSYKNLQDTATSSFISCCFMLAFSADISFYSFSELDSK